MPEHSTVSTVRDTVDTNASPDTRPKRPRLVSINGGSIALGSCNARYQSLIVHSPSFYRQWYNLYHCDYYTTLDRTSLLANEYPTTDKCANIPLVSEARWRNINCFELRHMSPHSDWCPRSIPILSGDFIRTFLAYVHHFTSLGLEAQATGFSYGANGVIKYLCLTPQVNTVGSVVSRVEGPTELDAVKEFAATDPSMNEFDFRSRCWIHTHPKYKAFMSAIDLCQLFMLRLNDDNSFGIVLSPREQGIKALCVHLTEDGYSKLKNYYELAKSNTKFFQYACARINDSCDTYYCQIPFVISPDATTVADLRSSEEVIGQLTNFYHSGQTEYFWK